MKNMISIHTARLIKNHYFELQNICISKDTVEFVTGYCGFGEKRKKSSWSYYIAICKTFEHCAQLTAAEFDSMIESIEYLCLDNSWVERAFPTEHRYLIN